MHRVTLPSIFRVPGAAINFPVRAHSTVVHRLQLGLCQGHFNVVATKLFSACVATSFTAIIKKLQDTPNT